jgi:hypothetical protein
VGDIVYYYPSGGEPNYFGQVLAAEIVKLCPEPGRVNLSVRHPEGCSCYMRKDVPQADGEPRAGSWEHRG